VLGEENPDTLNSMHNLAVLYRDEGKYAQAEPLFTRVLEVRRRVLGQEHPRTLNTMLTLAMLYRDQGKYTQAEQLVTKVLDVRRRVLGDQNPDTLISMDNLALLYRDEGKYAQAEQLYTKVLELQRRVLAPEHARRLASMNELAELYVDEGKYTQAEPLLRDALSTQEKNNSNDWRRYYCESLLGATLAGEKKYGEAEPLLLSGYEGMAQRQAAIPFGRRSVVKRGAEWIVQLYKSWGKRDKEGEWRNKVRAAHSPTSAAVSSSSATFGVGSGPQATGVFA
jgi:eukaryotic-like serine/threonine-protein kinase